MAVTDQQKLDFLLKKIGFTKTKTGSTVGTGAISGTPKQPFAEAIPSPLIIANGALWNESDQITATPPGSDTNQIKVYSASSALRMTADATSSGQRAYIAYSTYNDTSSTRLTNWIDTQFGALYLIKVYKGDPNSGGVPLSAGATNENWFFDYSAGVLNFNDSNVPSGVTDTNIYIVGYRYIGQTGAPTSGISTFSFLDLTVKRNLDVGTIGGISTFRNNIDLNADLDVDGHTNLDNVSVSGVSSFTGPTNHDGGATVDIHLDVIGLTTLDDVRVASGATFEGAIDANGDLDVDGHTELDNVNISGMTTFAGEIDANGKIVGIQTDNVIPFYYDNVSDFPSAATYHGAFAHAHNTGKAYFAHAGWKEIVSKEANGTIGVGTEVYNIGTLTVTGDVSIGGTLTYEDVTNIDSVGIITAREGIFIPDNKKLELGNAAGSGDLQLYHDTNHSYIDDAGTGNLKLRSGTIEISNLASSKTSAVFNSGSSQDLYYNNTKRFETTDTGAKISGDLNLTDIIRGYKYLAAPYSGTTTTLTVTVASKVSGQHRYHGQGSGLGYVIDGYQSPFFTLTPGNTYRFDQSDNSNSNHQIKFYLESDKTTLYEEGVTYNGSAGNSGAYTQIVVSDKTPVVLHYQCINHGYMGNAFQTNANVVNTNHEATLRGGLNVSGVSTFSNLVDVNANIDISGNSVLQGDLDVDGHTNLDNVSVAGVSTFAGNIDANGDLDVDGHTNLDNVSIAGITTGTIFKVPDATNVNGATNHIAIGDNSDLKLYHDNNGDAQIFNSTGHLTIVNNTAGRIINLQPKSGVNGIIARYEGAAELYYNGNLRLNTSSVGVSIPQDLDVDGHTNLDNVNIVGVTTHEGHVLPSADSTYDLGSSSKYWRHVYADNIGVGTDGTTIGVDIVTRNLQVNGISTHVGIATFNDATFHDDVTFTTANGNNIVFDKSDNQLEFGNNVKAEFGAGGQLEINFQSNTGNSSIQHTPGVGSLVLSGNKLDLRSNTGNHVYLRANYTNSVDLYFANTKRFETTNTGINVTGDTETDTLNTGNATFTGTINAGGATGTNGQYLKSTGSGVAWASFPTLRTKSTNTASAGQTTFSYNYTVGFLDVYVNGIKLTDAEFTATNGTSVVLSVGCFVGDIVELIGYNIASTGGGGGGGIQNIVEDTTPQLGGNLDLFNKTINGTGNINITGVATATKFVGDGSGLTGVTASGSGVIVKDGGTLVGTAQTINFGNNLSVSAISAGIVTITATDTNTQLTTEEVQDIVGAMFSGNTETNITATYQDSDGTIDLIASASNVSVSNQADNRLITATGTTDTLNAESGLTFDGTTLALTGNQNISGGIDVDGHTNLDNVSVAGVTTFASSTVFTGAIDANGDLDVDGHANLDNVSVAGVITATTFKGALEATSASFSSNIDANGDLDVDGHTNLDNVSVAGVSTFAGITTVTGSDLFTKRVNVSGISTFNDQINGTVLNLSANITASGSLSCTGASIDNQIIINGLQPKILFVDSNANPDYELRADGGVFQIIDSNTPATRFKIVGNDAVVGTGITLNGGNGHATYTGIVTAQKFVGDGSGLTGVTASGSGVVVQHDGSNVGTAGTINFGTNLDVSAISAGIVTITASGGGVTVQNDGSALSTSATTLNFVAGSYVGDEAVTASGSGATKTITISAVSINSDNTILGGNGAGASLSSGSSPNNTLLGASAGNSITTGNNNIALGASALRDLTTTGDNIALGRLAGRYNQGSENVFIGYQAAQGSTSYRDASRCVVIGHDAALNLGRQYGSVYIGHSAGKLQAGTGGVSNTVVGDLAFDASDTAVQCAVFGTRCGRSITSGSNNTLYGVKASQSVLQTGSNNTIIGFEAEASANSVSNEITLGNSSITKFRIPGINFVLKDNGGTPTQGHVLTVDANGEASFAAASGGGSSNVGITTNLSGSFTASAGSPSTINTFGYGSGDIVVEYTVFIKNGSNFQTQKLLAMRDGTTIHSTQFAVMFSSSLLVQLDATISGSNILLRATPETGVSGSTTYKIKREVM